MVGIWVICSCGEDAVGRRTTTPAEPSFAEDAAARETRRILWIVLWLNLGVAAAKFGYGLLTGSEHAGRRHPFLLRRYVERDRVVRPLGRGPSAERPVPVRPQEIRNLRGGRDRAATLRHLSLHPLEQLPALARVRRAGGDRTQFRHHAGDDGRQLGGYDLGTPAGENPAERDPRGRLSPHRQ